jgi:hypothetical protein
MRFIVIEDARDMETKEASGEGGIVEVLDGPPCLMRRRPEEPRPPWSWSGSTGERARESSSIDRDPSIENRFREACCWSCVPVETWSKFPVLRFFGIHSDARGAEAASAAAAAAREEEEYGETEVFRNVVDKPRGEETRRHGVSLFYLSASRWGLQLA